MTALAAWMQVPIDEFLLRVDALNADIGRALKIQHGDYLGRLAVHEADDPGVPPAVCSKLLDGS